MMYWGRFYIGAGFFSWGFDRLTKINRKLRMFFQTIGGNGVEKTNLFIPGKQSTCMQIVCK